jgi:hypothetical protein
MPTLGDLPLNSPEGAMTTKYKSKKYPTNEKKLHFQEQTQAGVVKKLSGTLDGLVCNKWIFIIVHFGNFKITEASCELQKLFTVRC